MDSNGILESLLARGDYVMGLGSLSLILLEIAQPQLGDGNQIRVQASADELALNAQAGIVTA